MHGEEWFDENESWIMGPDKIESFAFHMPKDNKALALEALKRLSAPDLSNDYIYKSHNGVQKSETLEEAMDALKWELLVRENEVTVKIEDIDDDTFDFNPDERERGIGDVIGIKPHCHATELDEKILRQVLHLLW
jgi:hypothetical protein